MNGNGGSKYQILRGGEPRAVRGAEARKRVQQALHGIVCQTPVPKDQRAWMYDLRRQRRHIYGSLLRYIDIAVAQGASPELLMAIPEMLAFYIKDMVEARDTDPRRAA